jgi:hypothetical protein
VTTSSSSLSKTHREISSSAAAVDNENRNADFHDSGLSGTIEDTDNDECSSTKNEVVGSTTTALEQLRQNDREQQQQQQQQQVNKAKLLNEAAQLFLIAMIRVRLPHHHHLLVQTTQDSQKQKRECGGLLSTDGAAIPSTATNDNTLGLVDAITFIVDTIDSMVIQPTGATLLEYRNDFFLVSLQLSSKRSYSKLAPRFVQKLVTASEMIQQKFQSENNTNDSAKATLLPWLTAGLSLQYAYPLRTLPAQETISANSSVDTPEKISSALHEENNNNSNVSNNIASIRPLQIIGTVFIRAVNGERIIHNLVFGNEQHIAPTNNTGNKNTIKRQKGGSESRARKKIDNNNSNVSLNMPRFLSLTRSVMI